MLSQDPGVGDIAVRDRGAHDEVAHRQPQAAPGLGRRKRRKRTRSTRRTRRTRRPGQRSEGGRKIVNATIKAAINATDPDAAPRLNDLSNSPLLLLINEPRILELM